MAKQSGQYDKVLKENLEITLPVIIKDLLGLDIHISEELPADMQHTTERKADVLKRVTDAAGNAYILHIEFQVGDEKEMVYRMAEYYVMLLRKYKLPIRQYVLFLKDTQPTMSTSINSEHFQFHFSLVRIVEADYRLFLRSDKPEIQMLGILGNYGNQDVDQVLDAIVGRIKEKSNSELSKSKYFKQLRIFALLRDHIGLHLEQKIEKTMDKVSSFFKEENDLLFIRGGRKKGEKIVKNLILQLGWDDDQIARIAEVTLDAVSAIRTELNDAKQISPA